MNSECYICTDYFEEDAICYCCYQSLKRQIEELQAELKQLREKEK